MTNVPAEPESARCEHHYAYHSRGGSQISVGICTLCQDINFDDLDRQAAELQRRPRLSYDTPITGDELIEHAITALRNSQRWASILDYVEKKTTAAERERIRHELIDGDPCKLELSLRMVIDPEEAAECAGLVADLLGGTGSQPECIHCNLRTGQCSNCLRSVEDCRCGDAIDDLLGGTGSQPDPWDDDESELRKVKLKPVNEAEDAW